MCPAAASLGLAAGHDRLLPPGTTALRSGPSLHPSRGVVSVERQSGRLLLGLNRVRCAELENPQRLSCPSSLPWTFLESSSPPLRGACAWSAEEVLESRSFFPGFSGSPKLCATNLQLSSCKLLNSGLWYLQFRRLRAEFIGAWQLRSGILSVHSVSLWLES